jgi:hypothetical protein
VSVGRTILRCIAVEVGIVGENPGGIRKSILVNECVDLTTGSCGDCPGCLLTLTLSQTGLGLQEVRDCEIRGSQPPRQYYSELACRSLYT